jgi:hypothetical protein
MLTLFFGGYAETGLDLYGAHGPSRFLRARHNQVEPQPTTTVPIHLKIIVIGIVVMAQPIPQALAHLIALNVEYSVLICIDRKCQYALELSAISRHLRDKHKTLIAVCKQVDQYVEAFPFVYDYKTVALPIDGSALQPIILIVDGFQCKERGECAFKTTDRSNIRKHANQVHSKKRIADEDICQAVRL